MSLRCMPLIYLAWGFTPQQRAKTAGASFCRSRLVWTLAKETSQYAEEWQCGALRAVTRNSPGEPLRGTSGYTHQAPVRGGGPKQAVGTRDLGRIGARNREL
jgi:hypothetical protein